MIEFSVSGINTYWWLPILVGFAMSLVASTAGLSGAFLLLPFQMSILGFTAPGVTPTNLIFNVVGIPGGVYRFWKEGRLIWALAVAMIIGSVPGMIIGSVIRITLLPDPGLFKLFVGCVLGYMALRVVLSLRHRRFQAAAQANARHSVTVISSAIFGKLEYSYSGQRHQVPMIPLILMSVVVGIIGGAYGIGGGALLAPILVALYRLPIHTTAGATLLSTLVGSLLGVISFWVLDIAQISEAASPDWGLGFLFGIGGLMGIYLGARLQRYLPERVIKVILAILMMYISVRYISGYF